MSGSEKERSSGSNTDYDDTFDEGSNDDDDGWDTTEFTMENEEDASHLAGWFADEIFTDGLLKEFNEIYYGLDTTTDQDTYDDDLYFKEQQPAAIRCTYKEGYMKRQDIYTCMDCNKKNKQFSAICFGCAVCCHRNHNVIDLYSKRNYRCDCGNEKFGLFDCKIYPHKDIFNSKNVYNDNFRGIYCICKQPYDINSKDKNGVMIQCVICEDWFHTIHLDVDPPKDEDGDDKDNEAKYKFDEFICFICTNKYAYLSKYTDLIDQQRSVAVPDDNTAINHNNTNKTLLLVVDSSLKSTPPNDANAKPCIIKNIPSKLPYTSLFMPSIWRSYLCRCDDCLEMYQINRHNFLLDEDDTLSIGTTPTDISDDDWMMDMDIESCKTAPPNNNNNNPLLPSLSSTFTYLNKNNNVNVVEHDTTKSIEKTTSTDNTSGVVLTTGTTESSETKLSPPDPKVDNFLSDIFNKKKPVKIHVPNNNNNNVNEAAHRKKRPKYDDNQNL